MICFSYVSRGWRASSISRGRHSIDPVDRAPPTSPDVHHSELIMDRWASLSAAFICVVGQVQCKDVVELGPGHVSHSKNAVRELPARDSHVKWAPEFSHVDETFLFVWVNQAVMVNLPATGISNSSDR